jgi:hypothetical protein
MKLRLGLVSNSSSSSFIVAFKQKERCLTCGRHFDDVIHRLEKSDFGYCNNEIYAIGEKEVISKINDYGDFEFVDEDIDDDKVQKSKHELVEKVKTLVKEGYQVSYISIDRCDENLLNYVRYGKNCEVIYEYGS